MSNPILEHYKNYYSREASPYTLEGLGETSRVLQLLDWVDEHTPQQGKVLDLGCGDMYLSTFPTKVEWVGIDINIDKAKGHALMHNLDVYPYPFPDQHFDTVVCSEVMEHMWDMRKIHKEVYRMLKPGGAYIVSTPNFDWVDHHYFKFQHLLWDPANRPHTSEHIRQYNFPVHEKHLKEAGFDIADVSGMDAQYTVMFQDARKYLKWLLADKLNLVEFKHDGRIDQVIGRMFPFISHTIGIVCRKK